MSGLSQYIEGWRRREAAEERRSEARATDARARLPQIVALLVAEFGARRVILFGSLAEGRFGAASDIDLAVEGLRGDWFAAWSAAERLLPGFRLDLVPLEAARPILRAAIERGEVLHEGP